MLTIDLQRSPEAPALARAAINGFCRDRNISASIIATVTLLVSEVVTNAVIHPDTEPLDTITMRASVVDEMVRVEVSDPGRRFTPRPRDPDRLDGGYGLYLVEQEAARWGLGAGPTTTVWFEVAGAAG
jgi:anti-sigma regulatory factor (Ser/Thr protein kinase)